MVSITEDTYKNMCDVLINNCNQIPQVKLKQLITHYELEIDSKRRLDNINNIKDLIRILEKRDCLSVDKPMLLCKIAGYLNLPNPYNSIQIEEKQSTETVKTEVIYKQPEGNGNIVKRKIHKKISEDIGKSWIDFARALDIRECEIDDLKMKKYSLKVCAEHILDYHEQEVYLKVWQSQVIQALRKARRNDLCKAVQDIIDNS